MPVAKYTRQQIELLDNHTKNQNLTRKDLGELTGLTLGQIKYSREKGGCRRRSEAYCPVWTTERLAELKQTFAEAPAGRKAHKYVREKMGLTVKQLSLTLRRHRDKLENLLMDEVKC